MSNAGAPARDLTIARYVYKLKPILPYVVFIVFAALPAAGLTPNIVRLFFVTFIWVICSVAWNMLGGFAGQISFGFSVFYGLGAYTAALMINAGINPYLSLLGAAAIAAIASFLIGLPTFRLRGPYFAIATIGVSEAVRVVMNNVGFTGGASGLRLTEHGPFHQVEHYYSALGVSALAVAISLWVSNSKFGMALKAIRQDEEAAAALGVNPYTSKLWAHALSAALTGIAGGLFARYAAYIHPSGVFAFQASVYILLMPVIGGIGTIWGPVLGGVVFGVVEEQLVANFPQVHLLLYGSLLILIILFEPDGLVGLLRRIFRRYLEHSRSEGADEVLWGRSRLEGREL